MEDKPAFVWKNRGSMVFVGDYRVSLSQRLLRALERRVGEAVDRLIRRLWLIDQARPLRASSLDCRGQLSSSLIPLLFANRTDPSHGSCGGRTT